MIKKQTKLILIGAAAALILLCAYLIFLRPLLGNLNATVSEPPELLEGEVLGMNNSIMMFEQVVRENIAELTVHNQNGEYAFYYNKDHDTFYIRGNDNAPYSKDQFSALVVAAGYPSVSSRLIDHCENMAEYGLDEASNPSWYKLDTRDGKSYKVYLGKPVPTGAGSYARFEGRDSVYIIDASSSATLLAPIEDMITAILAMPASQTDYHTVKNFLIARDGKPFVEITTNTEKRMGEDGEYEEYLNYEMLYPTNYNVSISTYDTLLQTFIEFYGTSVCELGNSEKMFDDETLEKYGLKNPAYEVFYEYKGVQNSIQFSKKNANGTYYAYSLMFDTISVVDDDTVLFLEYDLIEFIDKPLLQVNINDMARIKLESPTVTGDFRINGTGTDIVVTASDGRSIDADSFRQFYMALLTLQMVTYADTTDTAGLECIAKITIETDSGETTTFGFYPYATRRCLYTVNGVGEFYCLRSTVDTLVDYTQKLLNGEAFVYADRH